MYPVDVQIGMPDQKLVKTRGKIVLRCCDIQRCPGEGIPERAAAIKTGINQQNIRGILCEAVLDLPQDMPRAVSADSGIDDFDRIVTHIGVCIYREA